MGVSTMGLLYQLETELERELPGRLRQSLQRALDAYQAQCPACGLAMHRHHGSIMTWSCRTLCSVRDCRRLSSGADVQPLSAVSPDPAWLGGGGEKPGVVAGRVLEMDGLWTRAAAGRVEMKVIRDDKGVALATFAGWERAIDQAWQNGVTEPVHVVSDGDRAMRRAWLWSMDGRFPISCASCGKAHGGTAGGKPAWRTQQCAAGSGQLASKPAPALGRQGGPGGVLICNATV